MFGRRQRRKEARREEKLYKHLKEMYLNGRYENIISEVQEIDEEDRTNRVWFLMIESLNEVNKYRKAFRELSHMKVNCTEDADKAKWQYLNGLVMFSAGKQMLAQYSIEKGLEAAPGDEKLLELKQKVQAKEAQGFSRINELLVELENVLATMKQEAEAEGALSGCDEETFDLLLSYPAVIRKIPGIENCMGMEPFYRCATNEDVDAVKKYLWSNYQALEPMELADKALKEISVEEDFLYFRSFWTLQQGFSKDGLTEHGEANFDNFQSFAALFRDKIGGAGFRANELCEMMNLFRIEYACGMIDAVQLQGHMQETAKVVRESFSSWEDYARSLVSGAVYYTYKCSGGNFDATIAHMESFLAALPYCDWFHYGWYSEEADALVKSGKEKLAKREGKDVGSITLVDVIDNSDVFEEDEEEDAPSDGTILIRAVDSEMVVIPASQSDLDAFGEETELTREIDGVLYTITLRKVPVDIPKTANVLHFFRTEETEIIRSAKLGLSVSVPFETDPYKDYHAQLKIIYSLLPKAVAVYDVCAEKLLNGRWVGMASICPAAPQTKYLYTAQAVQSEEGELWMHTKGLVRCGVPELEILRSDRENFQKNYNVLNMLATRLLEGIIIKEKEPLFLAKLPSGKPLIVTLLNWKEGVAKHHGAVTVGEAMLREGVKKSDYYTILCYPNEDTLTNSDPMPLSNIIDELKTVSRFPESVMESERVRDTARDRIVFMKDFVGREGVHVLANVGLEAVNAENPMDKRIENLDFEIIRVEESKFTGVALRDSSTVTGLTQGLAVELSYDSLMDWVILYGQGPNERITPDQVYMITK